MKRNHHRHQTSMTLGFKSFIFQGFRGFVEIPDERKNIFQGVFPGDSTPMSWPPDFLASRHEAFRLPRWRNSRSNRNHGRTWEAIRAARHPLFFLKPRVKKTHIYIYISITLYYLKTRKKIKNCKLWPASFWSITYPRISNWSNPASENEIAMNCGQDGGSIYIIRHGSCCRDSPQIHEYVDGADGRNEVAGGHWSRAAGPSKLKHLLEAKYIYICDLTCV